MPGLSRDQLSISIEGNRVHLSSVEGAPRQVQRAWELEEFLSYISNPPAMTADIRALIDHDRQELSGQDLVDLAYALAQLDSPEHGYEVGQAIDRALSAERELDRVAPVVEEAHLGW